LPVIDITYRRYVMALTMEEVAKRLEGLEKEAKVSRDILEIMQLQHLYVNGIFLGRWEDLDACFSENSTFGEPREEGAPEGGPGQMKGKEIVEWLKSSGQGGGIDKVGGFVVQPIISVDVDKATGSWILYMLYTYEVTGQTLFWIQRTYDAIYARENGKWVIHNLVMKSRLGPPGPPYPGTGGRNSMEEAGPTPAARGPAGPE
jgi:hypothetical protein